MSDIISIDDRIDEWIANARPLLDPKDRVILTVEIGSRVVYAEADDIIYCEAEALDVTQAVHARMGISCGEGCPSVICPQDPEHDHVTDLSELMNPVAAPSNDYLETGVPSDARRSAGYELGYRTGYAEGCAVAMRLVDIRDKTLIVELPFHPPAELAKSILDALGAAALPGADRVLIIDHGIKLSALDDRAMLEAGWRRVDRVEEGP